MDGRPLPLKVQLSRVKVATYRPSSQPRMFSQFRQAVESLAQPLQSQDNPLSADLRSQSPDPLRQSSAQLAENARVNLRKSIAAQRSASPAQQNIPRPRSASPGPSSTTKSTSDSGLRKTTLEERLRASLAVSESSPGIAPSASPTPVTQRPLSPTSTPVSDSPSIAIGTTASVLDTPIGSSVQADESGHFDEPLAPPQEPNGATQPPDLTPPTDPTSSAVNSADVTHSDSITNPCVTPTQEAPQVTSTDLQQPPIQQCTQASEVVDASTVDADLSGEESVEAEPEPTITADRSNDVDVEALQERLKLVEQRFAGETTYLVHLG